MWVRSALEDQLTKEEQRRSSLRRDHSHLTLLRELPRSLPDRDEAAVLEAQLTEEEQRRNSRRQDLIHMLSSHSLLPEPSRQLADSSAQATAHPLSVAAVCA